MKQFLLKGLLITIVIGILEYLLILLASGLRLFFKYKININTDMITNHLIHVAKHPVKQAIMLSQSDKPIYIIVAVGLAIYVLFSYMKASYKSKKNGWEVDESTGYHGTARFAKQNEIEKDKNFWVKSQNQILKEFEKSLKG